MSHLFRFSAFVFLIFAAIPANAQHSADELLQVERRWLDAYDNHVRFFGEATAVISGTYNFEVTNANGEASVTQSLYTDTYMYLDNRWQVIASHLSNK